MIVAETVNTAREDADILQDIIDLMHRYPPLMNDLRRMRFNVTGGTVVLGGHVKTHINRRWLAQNLPMIEGVKHVVMDALHDEETIRVEAGKHIPMGVLANVEYGAVILSGKPMVDADMDAVLSRIAAIPGVEKVFTMVKR